MDVLWMIAVRSYRHGGTPGQNHPQEELKVKSRLFSSLLKVSKIGVWRQRYPVVQSKTLWLPIYNLFKCICFRQHQPGRQAGRQGSRLPPRRGKCHPYRARGHTENHAKRV